MYKRIDTERKVIADNVDYLMERAAKAWKAHRENSGVLEQGEFTKLYMDSAVGLSSATCDTLKASAAEKDPEESAEG